MAQEEDTRRLGRTKVTLRVSLLGQILIPANPQHSSPPAGCHEIQGDGMAVLSEPEAPGLEAHHLPQLRGFWGTSHNGVGL